jgi:hypothetical protein
MPPGGRSWSLNEEGLPESEVTNDFTLSIDGNGVSGLSWFDRSVNAAQTAAQSADAAAAWNPDSPQDPGTAVDGSIFLLQAATGEALQFWVRSVGGVERVAAVRTFNSNQAATGGGYPPAADLYTEIGEIVATSGTIANDGNSMILIADSRQPTLQFFVGDNQGNFTGPFAIPGTSSATVTNISAAVDPFTGNVFATYAADNNLWVIGYNAQTRRWNQVIPLASGIDGTLNGFQAAVDSFGTAAVAYRDSISGVVALQSFPNFQQQADLFVTQAITPFTLPSVDSAAVTLIAARASITPPVAEPVDNTFTVAAVNDPGLGAALQLEAAFLTQTFAAKNLKGKLNRSRCCCKRCAYNLLTWRANKQGPKIRSFNIYRDVALTKLAGKVSAKNNRCGKYCFKDKCFQGGTYFLVARYADGTLSPRQAVTINPQY